MTVPELIHDELRRHGVATDDLLLCAVSGGGDSVSLAAALHNAGYRRLHLAWINHNLRSREEMSRDSALVHALGARLKAPVLHEELPEGLVLSHARAEGRSIEEVARRLRYEALRGIATRLALSDSSGETVYLLTAHHRDDQTETVLSRIADGHPATVPLAIPSRRTLAEKPVQVTLVRPALNLAGSALREWGEQWGVQWAEDTTNRDVTFRRNALRHRVLPPFTEVLPDSGRMIARFGSSHDHLLSALRALIPRGASGRLTSAEWSVDRDPFLALPEAAQELLLRDAAYHVSASNRVDAGFIGEMLRQLSSAKRDRPTIRISGTDLVCVATDETITVTRDIVPRGQRGYLLPVTPGSVVTVNYDEEGVIPSGNPDSGVDEASCVAGTSIAFPAVFRDQRDGDVMVWHGRERTVPEVARRAGVPRALRPGAAVVESTVGIEVVFWRGGRWAARDGGTWQERCANPKPSAVIFRMQG